EPMCAHAKRRVVRSNFATATTRLSSWMRVPWISPEVEQPMTVERGNASRTRSIGVGLSISSDAPNIITSVRSESRAASGSDDHAPSVKLYVRISIVQDPFVRLAPSIRETDRRHDLIDARSRLRRGECGIEQRRAVGCTLVAATAADDRRVH